MKRSDNVEVSVWPFGIVMYTVRVECSNGEQLHLDAKNDTGQQDTTWPLTVTNWCNVKQITRDNEHDQRYGTNYRETYPYNSYSLTVYK